MGEAHRYLESAFPNLQRTQYDITSPRAQKYNCIAWAADDDRRWWWPVRAPDVHWPIEWCECTVECFVAAFRSLGYELCEDTELEEGHQKVVLYSLDGRPTHMARQLTSGAWTSKFGRGEDITHTLEGLEGSAYGAVVTVLRRRVQ